MQSRCAAPSLELGGVGELIDRELPDRIEQPVPGRRFELIVHADQGLVDERGQQVEYRRAGIASSAQTCSAISRLHPWNTDSRLSSSRSGSASWS